MRRELLALPLVVSLTELIKYSIFQRLSI